MPAILHKKHREAWLTGSSDDAKSFKPYLTNRFTKHDGRAATLSLH
jgi:hypothetical protein